MTWSTDSIIPLLAKATREDLAILKVHSHPNGFPQFSTLDDKSDGELFDSVFGWTDSTFPHASAIMLPDEDGTMFGRAILPDGTFQQLDSILVPGDNLHFWTANDIGKLPSFTQRHAQLFGLGTTRKLREMAVAVVGCSGTGSPVIEQLARLGVGRFVLVDPDKVEEKNLNRILNSTHEDAVLGRLKVEVMSRAITEMGFGTEVEIIPEDLATPEAVKKIAECDVIFGCMDGVEGRHRLNRLASFYVLPYFDLGVRLDADGEGGINGAFGVVNYIRPDGTTLNDRGLYTLEQLKSAGLLRTNPKAYREQVEAGYIRGVAVDRPAVISINMQIASTAVNEFLARLHPYRSDDNKNFAMASTSFFHGFTRRDAEESPSGMFFNNIGKGDVYPLLEMPLLSDEGIT
ncbi:HesA/MoeB/ThiF family protein [Methanoregula sp.]|uniref:HesA/MoeB/ThiF family protein n=1 Tax=Methanoregula sp. TaxID=2052170 RepID=UPI003C2221F9